MSDKVLLVARVDTPSGRYLQRADDLGYSVWHRSMLDIAAYNAATWLPKLDNFLRSAPTHLIFSSQQAASAVVLQAAELLSRSSLFAVGAATAQRLSPFRVAVPENGEGAEALLNTFQKRFGVALKEQRFVLLQASDVQSEMERQLRDLGVDVAVLHVYERNATTLTGEEGAMILRCRLADIGSASQLRTAIDVGLPTQCALMLPSMQAIALARASGFENCRLVESNELSRISALG